MIRYSLVGLALAFIGVACTSDQSTRHSEDSVILVPDWQNNVVHRIALDGAYEGDFLARGADASVGTNALPRLQPTGILFIGDQPGVFWLLWDKGISAWNGAGEAQKDVLLDTQILETPTCAVRVGDRVFVASPDTKNMNVFDIDGTHRGTFGHPYLHYANDCKLGPDGQIYVGSMLHSGVPGLVSIWDPQATSPDTKPRDYRIPGNANDDETYWIQGLAFDDDGDLLITEFSRGRLERWDLETNTRSEVLLDSDEGGAYLKLERGPDGMMYLAGTKGIYRFDSRAKAADLVGLSPFFDARQLEGKYPHKFSPAGISFAPRGALGPPH